MRWLYSEAKTLAPFFAATSDEEALAAVQSRLVDGTDLRREPTEARRAIWQGRWGSCGMPTVRFSGADYAASICCTAAPPEVWESLLSPWPSWALLVPAELGLEMEGRPINLIGVLREERVWHIHCLSVGPTSRSLHVYSRVPLEELCLDPKDLGDPQPMGEMPHGVTVPSRDIYPQSWVSQKLIAGACLSFAAGQCRNSSNKARRARREPLPTRWEFVVGAPVRTDCIRYVRDYLGGKGNSPRVQSLVRGHWRMQPYGKDGTLRRPVQIEPYWRGPEDGSIAVRSHVIGARKKGD